MAAASLSVLGLSIPNDNDDCSQGAAGRTLEMLNNETTITQAAKSGKSILRHLTSSVNLSQNTPPLAPPKKKHIYNNVEAKRLYPDIYTSRSSVTALGKLQTYSFTLLRNAGRIAQLELNLVANRNANHRRWSSAAALGPTCSFPARWPGHFGELLFQCLPQTGQTLF